jgi:hypothetical protein
MRQNITIEITARDVLTSRQHYRSLNMARRDKLREQAK